MVSLKSTSRRECELHWANDSCHLINLCLRIPSQDINALGGFDFACEYWKSSSIEIIFKKHVIKTHIQMRNKILCKKEDRRTKVRTQPKSEKGLKDVGGPVGDWENVPQQRGTGSGNITANSVAIATSFLLSVWQLEALFILECKVGANSNETEISMVWFICSWSLTQHIKWEC